jgi:hypothetical protein
MASTSGAETTQDAFLGGRVQLLQPRKGYRAGLDPVLLAASVPAQAGDTVLELGCGVGAALFCLAARVPGLTLTGVELQADYADLARQNADLNGTGAEIVTAICGPARAPAQHQLRPHSGQPALLRPDARQRCPGCRARHGARRGHAARRLDRDGGTAAAAQGLADADPAGGPAGRNPWRGDGATRVGDDPAHRRAGGARRGPGHRAGPQGRARTLATAGPADPASRRRITCATARITPRRSKEFYAMAKNCPWAVKILARFGLQIRSMATKRNLS